MSGIYHYYHIRRNVTQTPAALEKFAMTAGLAKHGWQPHQLQHLSRVFTQILRNLAQLTGGRMQYEIRPLHKTPPKMKSMTGLNREAETVVVCLDRSPEKVCATAPLQVALILASEMISQNQVSRSRDPKVDAEFIRLIPHFYLRVRGLMLNGGATRAALLQTINQRSRALLQYKLIAELLSPNPIPQDPLINPMRTNIDRICQEAHVSAENGKELSAWSIISALAMYSVAEQKLFKANAERTMLFVPDSRKPELADECRRTLTNGLATPLAALDFAQLRLDSQWGDKTRELDPAINRQQMRGATLGFEHQFKIFSEWLGYYYDHMELAS
ncbi:MAG: hypothetical protein HQ596_03175 [Candidatus Saganbacteria bacterium]|nr:hypothetical protein [Candidatus Saganbacteria bacterium]